LKDGNPISVRAIFSVPGQKGLRAHLVSNVNVKALYPEAKVAGVDHQLLSSAEVNERV